MLKFIARIAENPYLNLISGSILVVTAGWEVITSFHAGRIGAHHGILVFGIIQIIQCLPHILHGSEQLAKFRNDEE